MSRAFCSRSGTRSTTNTLEAPRISAEYAAISPTGPAPYTTTLSPGDTPASSQPW
jgi:hypothetical protein